MEKLIILAFVFFVVSTNALAQTDTIRSVAYGVNNKEVIVMAIRTPKGICIQIGAIKSFFRKAILDKDIPDKISAIQDKAGNWIPAGVFTYKLSFDREWIACYYSLKEGNWLKKAPFIHKGIEISFEQRMKGFPFLN